jgi:hypothetical protein
MAAQAPKMVLELRCASPHNEMGACKGNIMISMNCVLLARENQRSIAEQTKQLFTHLARENQREKSKVFPAEGATIYNKPCDKRMSNVSHGVGESLKGLGSVMSDGKMLQHMGEWTGGLVIGGDL